MKILFTFPGQGGQRPGMLAMIPDREAILTQARAVLGDEVDTLDSADALQHTRAVQLCLLIAGVAWARVLWDPQRIADDLAMNMARPVHWQEAMVAADERDARLAIEMPPGGVLTCLTRQAGWRGETIALERSGLDVARHLAQRLSD